MSNARILIMVHDEQKLAASGDWANHATGEAVPGMSRSWGEQHFIHLRALILGGRGLVERGPKCLLQFVH